MDPWRRFVIESIGDYLPRDKWCTVENCSVRHMHVKNDHPCNDCGYRHGASSGVHYALTCTICRTVCRISESSLRPDDDAEEEECHICYHNGRESLG
jgi:hypothetical protein